MIDKMIDKLTDWLIKRRMKKLHIPVVIGSASSRDEFKRVLNTLRENKIMVDTREDGIYIRMAGNENKGECFSLEWAKVKSLPILEYETKEQPTFYDELKTLINRYSIENESNTPDFILADYLLISLANWETTCKAREKWYGKK